MSDKEVKGLELDSEEWQSLVPDVMSNGILCLKESFSDSYEKLNKWIEEIKSRKLIK